MPESQHSGTNVETAAVSRPYARDIPGVGALGGHAPRRPWLALTVLLSGMFMALLDSSIVNVALSEIRADLSASGSELTWILSGYMLAFGVALIPAGRVGDRVGHKWTFIAGIGLFVVASLACGLAQNPTHLVVARIVQGFAGGVFVPAVTAFIQLLFAGSQRGRAFAIMGSVIGVATAVGPLAGGILIGAADDSSGWRLIFVVNVPIGLLACLCALRLLPAPTAAATPARGFDFTGLALLVVGLSAILLPVISGPDSGWPAWTFAALGSGAGVLVLFGIWERHVAAQRRAPLVPLHLFRRAAFTGGALLALTYFAGLMSVFFAFSITWQVGFGHSALESGATQTPFAIGSIVGAAASGRLIDRHGRRALISGIAMVLVGLAIVIAILLAVPAAELQSWMFMSPFLLAGFGSGLSIGPNARFIVATVQPHDAGAASGVINTMQRVGSSIGIAVVSGVFFGTLASTSGTGVQPSAPEAYANSAAIAISVSAAFALAAFLLSFSLPRTVDPSAVSPAGRPARERAGGTTKT